MSTPLPGFDAYQIRELQARITNLQASVEYLNGALSEKHAALVQAQSQVDTLSNGYQAACTQLAQASAHIRDLLSWADNQAAPGVNPQCVREARAFLGWGDK